jgi:LytS/YehU family sensor histidine kinase
MTRTNTETKYREDIAVARNDIATIKVDIAEIKEYLKTQDERYVTRLELKITRWVFGAMVSAITLFFVLKDHIK